MDSFAFYSPTVYDSRREGESCQVSALAYRKEQSSGRGSELCL